MSSAKISVMRNAIMVVLICSSYFTLFASGLTRPPSSCLSSQRTTTTRLATRAYSATTLKAASAAEHEYFLKEVAKIDVPKKLDALVEMVELQGQEILSPFQRAGLNPFLIPISRNTSDNTLLCYLRWPTQKIEMDLQLVRTNEVGVALESLSTDRFVHRQLVEMDFYNHPNVQKANEVANKDSHIYTLGDHVSFTKSGKFPSTTDEERRLVLDRYLLTKVGSFPDCYERLANNFFNNKNDVSGLVTCERASSVFYGWGHISSFHALALHKIGREKEGSDTARSSMHLPKWTIARTSQVCCLMLLNNWFD